MLKDWDWTPPRDWTAIRTIDLHTGGEPLRVFTSGLPPIPGRTILEKRRYFRDHLDHLRTGTMWEPRGHADMYGPYPAVIPEVSGTASIVGRMEFYFDPADPLARGFIFR